MRTIQILGCFSVSFFLFEEAGILKPKPNGKPLKFITANYFGPLLFPTCNVRIQVII